jgi:hypothetical protein
MLDEPEDIESELDRIKHRLRCMTQLLGKRQLCLLTLSDEEFISEVGFRTMPAANIVKLLVKAEKPKKGRKR